MPSRAQLEELLKSEPDDTFLLYALAKAYVSEGDVAMGLAQFDEVLKRDPKHVPAHFQKGQVLAEDGQTDAAREILNQGIQVAKEVGDDHALGEMLDFLASLE